MSATSSYFPRELRRDFPRLTRHTAFLGRRYHEYPNPFGSNDRYDSRDAPDGDLDFLLLVLVRHFLFFLLWWRMIRRESDSEDELCEFSAERELEPALARAIRL